jgi:hypothetical protein
MNRGLCVGGPLDGEYAEHTSNMMRIPQLGEVMYRADRVTPAEYQPNLFYSYVFVSRYWIPYDIRQGVRPITDVLEILERCYVNERRANASEVPMVPRVQT